MGYIGAVYFAGVVPYVLTCVLAGVLADKLVRDRHYVATFPWPGANTECLGKRLLHCVVFVLDRCINDCGGCMEE